MRMSAVAGIVAAAMAMAQPVSGVTPTKNAATKCPGWLRADQHTVGGQRLRWTIALEDKDKKDQWWPTLGTLGVHVAFQSTEPPLRSVEFIVSYLPPGLREMPVGREASAQVLKKSYTLAGDDKARVEGNLLVGSAAAVTRVRLISATFADGSEWHAASDGACSVEPNRVMPVDGKESSLEW